MKFVISLAVLAFAVTFVSARCIYSGGSNKPNCKADSDPSKKYHHNYNPNAYFYCDGVEAKVQSCGDKCFYGTDCVPCDPNSRHIPVCNETEQDNQVPEELNETTTTVIATAGQNEQVDEVTEQGYETTETVTYPTEPETEPNAIGSDNKVPEDLNETTTAVIATAGPNEQVDEVTEQGYETTETVTYPTEPETEPNAIQSDNEVPTTVNDATENGEYKQDNEVPQQESDLNESITYIKTDIPKVWEAYGNKN